jgi:hypothetical protein
VLDEVLLMKRAALLSVVAILALAFLVHRHVITAATFGVIVMLAAAVLVYMVLIWPNLKRRS